MAERKQSVIPVLRQAAFSELACQFARFIERQDKTGDSLIALSAALLTDAVSQGQVCLNLAQQAEHDASLDELIPETTEEWLSRLRQSHFVAAPGHMAPLILTEDGALYLYRYWYDEQTVSKLVEQKCQPIEINDVDSLKQDFSQWPSQHEIDWQKVAVLMAVSRQFSVISGGPGTGKTTIVLHLLQALIQQDSDLKIALAAPTGKAAIRLQQSVIDNSDFDIEAKTLHRLLGITADNEHGRYNAASPLPVDVLIVDEASMIDISLMATLMKSLSATARLVLLGDSHQLSSVESGAVLANLCHQGMTFSKDFSQHAADVLAIDLPFTDQPQTAMTDSVVMLQHSYRFGAESELGQLAEAVKNGNDEAVIRQLLSASELNWSNDFEQATLSEQFQTIYADFFDAVQTHQSAKDCLRHYEKSRVLCALKKGPESVESVNNLIERELMRRGWRSQQRFYHGRPIMVTQNDYRQSLFNGDTGLVLYNENGVLSACFLFNDQLRWLPLNRLPAHETAFAMSIHKSQGSEFEQISVLLPEQMSPVLTRALLYTAITRSKKALCLLATESIIRNTVTAEK